MIKVIAWLVGIGVIGYAMLIVIGLYIHGKAEDFSRQEGGFINVQVIAQSNNVLCGRGIGLIVREYDTPKRKVYPVCAGIFDDAELGRWRNR